MFASAEQEDSFWMPALYCTSINFESWLFCGGLAILVWCPGAQFLLIGKCNSFSPSWWRGRCDLFHHELSYEPLPSISTNSGEGEKYGVHPLSSGFLKGAPCWVYWFYRHQSTMTNFPCSLLGDTERKLTCITEDANEASHTVSRNLQRNIYHSKTPS